MLNATEQEISSFKNKYCKNDLSRSMIMKDFRVRIESFEELGIGKKVKSYATGCRDIENSFMIFKVIDEDSEITFYPVFSESIGRKMVRNTDIVIPPKLSIFLGESTKSQNSVYKNSKLVKKDKGNIELRRLIAFVRSLMILHIDEPKSMDGIFKEIYDALEHEPSLKVKKQQIKSVNTALGNFIKKEVNTKNENFKVLQDYIDHLKYKKEEKRLKNVDFSSLVELMQINYPEEQIYF